MRSNRRLSANADHQKFNDDRVASRLTMIAAEAIRKSGKGATAEIDIRQKKAACAKLTIV